MPISTNTTPSGELKEAAERLLEAAMDYHAAYRKAGLAGAVVWIQDTTGRMVILTRGEYRHTLMENIDRVYRDDEDGVLSFDGEG